MALYLVSYDLTDKDYDCESFWERLEYWKSVKLLYSTWLIAHQSGEMAIAIANDLAEHIMESDRLLVHLVHAQSSASESTSVMKSKLPSNSFVTATIP
jgi:hypothetical protein